MLFQAHWNFEKQTKSKSPFNVEFVEKKMVISDDWFWWCLLGLSYRKAKFEIESQLDVLVESAISVTMSVILNKVLSDYHEKNILVKIDSVNSSAHVFSIKIERNRSVYISMSGIIIQLNLNGQLANLLVSKTNKPNHRSPNHWKYFFFLSKTTFCATSISEYSGDR